MSIRKIIENSKSYVNDHIELVKKSKVKPFFLFAIPMYLTFAAIPLAIYAPMVGIPLYFLGLFSFIVAPIFVNYIHAFWKILSNKDNRTLFKELRKNGISLSRILDLFACSNATSINSEVLKIIAESKLDLVDIQSLMETKEQVDMINSVNSKNLQLIADSGKFSMREIKAFFSDSKETSVLNVANFEMLKLIINSDKFDSRCVRWLLHDPKQTSGLNAIDHEKLKMLLASSKLKHNHLTILLGNIQEVDVINSISVKKLMILLNSNEFQGDHLFGILVGGTQTVATLCSISAEKREMLFASSKLGNYSITQLLGNEQVANTIKFIALDELKMLFSSDELRNEHLVKLLKNIKAVNTIYSIDLEKRKILLNSNKFRGSDLIELLESTQAVNVIKSIDIEMLKLIVNIDGFNVRHIIDLLSDSEAITVLNSIDTGILRLIINRSKCDLPDFNLLTTSMLELRNLKNISNNVKKNPALATEIFSCKFLYDSHSYDFGTAFYLYSNQYFDVKQIERNFKFASALHEAGKINNVSSDYLFYDTQVLSDARKYLNRLPYSNYSLEDLNKFTQTDLVKIFSSDGQSTHLQELGIKELITEPKSDATQHYQTSL